MNIVILISVLVIIGIIGIATRVRKKPVYIPRQRAIRYFKAAINYKVSFMTEVDGRNYSLINVSITNNSNEDLKNISIQCEPHTPALDSISLKHPDKLANSNIEQLHYESLTRQPLNVRSGSMVSGFLIYESPDDNCHITELEITGKDQVDTLNIQPNRIVRETTAARQF